MQALFIIRTFIHIICLPLFNIYNWLISQNSIFFHFAKSSSFFISQNSDLQACDLVFRYENSPLECTLFLLSERSITSYIYLCLIFTIGSFRKIQIFFTDLQQTVCGRNWFISQNPDFINVVKNVDFAKSRFFLFRRIHISQFRKIQLSLLIYYSFISAIALYHPVIFLRMFLLHVDTFVVLILF